MAFIFVEEQIDSSHHQTTTTAATCLPLRDMSYGFKVAAAEGKKEDPQGRTEGMAYTEDEF